MTNASDYLEVQLREHLFRSGSFTKPGQLFVALHTADPTDGGSGAEVSGGGYARAQCDPGDERWTGVSGTDGVTTNNVEIVFPVPTANWGTITHFGIWDSATAGHLLGHGALTVVKVVNLGSPAPRFAAGALVVTFA